MHLHALILCSQNSKQKATVEDCDQKSIIAYVENYQGNLLKDTANKFARINEQLQYKNLCEGSANLTSDSTVCAIFKRWANAGQITRYQNPITWSWLNTMSCAIDTILGSRGQNIRYKPILASIPKEETNAEIVPIEGCKRRMLFFNDFNLLFAYSCPRELIDVFARRTVNGEVAIDRSLESIKAKINSNDDFKERFWGLFSIISGNGNDETPLTSDPLLQQYIIGLTSGIECFLITHEYAHELRGHFEDMKESSVSQVQFPWWKELEADYYGVGILKSYILKEYPDLVNDLIWAPDIFLTNIDLQNYSVLIHSTLAKHDDQYLDIDTPTMNLLRNKAAAMKWTNMDSIVDYFDKRLPRNPTSEDFQNLIDTYSMAGVAHSTHPPTYLRRVVVRLAIKRNQPKAYTPFNLKTTKTNFGDAWWYAVTLFLMDGKQ